LPEKEEGEDKRETRGKRQEARGKGQGARVYSIQYTVFSIQEGYSVYRGQGEWGEEWQMTNDNIVKFSISNF
jgi:hypothetical protein